MRSQLEDESVRETFPRLNYRTPSAPHIADWVIRLIVFFIVVDIAGTLATLAFHWGLRAPWRFSFCMGFGASFLLILAAVIFYTSRHLRGPGL